MPGPRVKVCGVTSIEDARLCHESGADLVGLVLAASPRQLDPVAAAAMVAAVPGARFVAVVRDQATAALALRIRVAGAHVVQLHGCADGRRWAAVAEACRRPVLPAVTADRAAVAFAAARARPRLPLEGLLLDLPKSGLHDPTRARRQLWRAARRGLAAGLPIMLAGGLDAADLGRVRRDVGPCGLDVCRGTERGPGIKDPQRVRAFLAAARTPEVRHVS